MGVSQDKTMEESVHKNTLGIFNWESRTDFKWFIHRTTFNSKCGVVNGVSRASLVLVPTKKTDDSQDLDKIYILRQRHNPVGKCHKIRVNNMQSLNEC